MSVSIRRSIATACLALALVLTSINIVGIVMGDRVFDTIPQNYIARSKFGRKSLITSDEQLDRRTGETAADYFQRLNDRINSHMVHIWPTSAAITYNASVPLFENYVLFALSKINPERFGAYEFLDVERALRRGVGLCSQVSMVASAVLQRNGFQSAMVGLDGHVIATARADDGQWYVLDPDYGVIMPYDIATIERNPELIESYYPAHHYSAAAIETLKSIYGEEGNFIFEEGARGYKGLGAVVETLAYFLKWAIPFALLFVAILLLVLPSVNRERVGDH